MPASDTVAVVRHYREDMLGGGRLDLLDELVAPGYVDRTARPDSHQGLPGSAWSLRCSAWPSLT